MMIDTYKFILKDLSYSDAKPLFKPIIHILTICIIIISIAILPIIFITVGISKCFDWIAYKIKNLNLGKIFYNK